MEEQIGQFLKIENDNTKSGDEKITELLKKIESKINEKKNLSSFEFNWLYRYISYKPKLFTKLHSLIDDKNIIVLEKPFYNGTNDKTKIKISKIFKENVSNMNDLSKIINLQHKFAKKTIKIIMFKTFMISNNNFIELCIFIFFLLLLCKDL